MSETVSVAVVGLGSMGSNHVRIYRDLPGVRLVGLADPDERRREAAAIVAPDVPVFADLRSMLRSTQPEAISIVTPTMTHLEMGLAALDAGAHVLIEKPIAADLAEGMLLIRSAAAAERLLMVGHIERFNPAVGALKRHLAAGQPGRIYQLQAQRVGPFPARIRDVGVVRDLAPHDIDVMRYLLGDEVTRVYAETRRNLNTQHEDMLYGLLHFRSGVVGVLDINWLTPEKVRRLRVLAENGSYELDYLTQTLDFTPNTADASPAPRIRLWPKVTDAIGEPLRIELAAFIEAVQMNAPSPMSGIDALAALDLATRLVESGEAAQTIEVDHPLIAEITEAR